MPSIVVQSLTKSYGRLQAVRGVSFTVEKGEVFSLLGPNGAGKTTTVEMLEGLRERDGGDVSVLGLDPWRDGYALHKKIGVIPQGFRFFDYPTPLEAVQYYAALFGVQVDAGSILRRVLLDDSDGTYFSKLSGGQKQKLGLALSLVNDPEVLFLDEPTTGLDPQARRAMWEVIRNLKKEGRSVLLTTHYLEEAEELAERVAIMNKGTIIAEGTPTEIISEHGRGETLTVRGEEALAKHVRDATGLQADYDGKGGVHIAIPNRGDVLGALRAVEESGLAWEDIQLKRDSLEDIFLRMVGGGRTEGS